MKQNDQTQKTPIRSATISIEEAGKILGVGRDASYRAVHNGEIPAIKIGRRLRVPRVALQRLLETGDRPDTSPAPSNAPSAS